MLDSSGRSDGVVLPSRTAPPRFGRRYGGLSSHRAGVPAPSSTTEDARTSPRVFRVVGGCVCVQKSPAADLGKQFWVRGDVLLDGLWGLTGDLFDVMSGAVVAVLAMQTYHGQQMLLNEVGLPRVPQVLAQPVIVGKVFGADGPSQCARVLLG